jgi:hypothetical protein
VVKLWWFGGEMWCFDGHFSAPKNTPPFLDLFLEWVWKSEGDDKNKVIMLSLRPQASLQRLHPDEQEH